MKGFKIKMLLGFVAGIVSGLMLAVGMTVWANRPGLPDGDAPFASGMIFMSTLLSMVTLPLIGLLICFGIQLGVMDRDIREYRRGYDAGYEDGLEDGTIDIRPVRVEVIGLTKHIPSSTNIS